MRHDVNTLRALGVNVQHVVVRLNGEEIRHVMAVDEDVGKAWLSRPGPPPADAEEWPVNEVTGDVALVLRPRPDGSWPHHVVIAGGVPPGGEARARDIITTRLSDADLATFGLMRVPTT